MRINHISGLKGLAIIQVVFMHFYLVLQTSMSVHCIPKAPHLFVNGSFAVCLFLILSGYVISLSSVKILHLGQLSSSIVKRYFRIAVPISMIVVIAYILYLWGLYRIQELATDTNNELAAFYYKNISFRSFVENLLFSPLGCHEVLAPCWMLGYIFFGTVFVYILKICIRPLCFTNQIVVLLFAMYGFYIFSSILWSCVVFGVLTQVIDEKLPTMHKNKATIILSFMLLLGGVYVQSIPYNVINTDYKINSISAILVWMGVNYNKPLRIALSIRPLVWFGNISFSVYLVHWPVICTITCYLYYGLSKLNYITMLWINIAITLFVIILISTLYHKFIEEKSTVVVSKIMQLYNR